MRRNFGEAAGGNQLITNLDFTLSSAHPADVEGASTLGQDWVTVPVLSPLTGCGRRRTVKGVMTTHGTAQGLRARL